MFGARSIEITRFSHLTVNTHPNVQSNLIRDEKCIIQTYKRNRQREITDRVSLFWQPSRPLRPLVRLFADWTALQTALKSGPTDGSSHVINIYRFSTIPRPSFPPDVSFLYLTSQMRHPLSISNISPLPKISEFSEFGPINCVPLGRTFQVYTFVKLDGLITMLIIVKRNKKRWSFGTRLFFIAYFYCLKSRNSFLFGQIFWLE